MNFDFFILEPTGCPRIKFTSCAQFYKEYKEQIITKIFLRANTFERSLKNSILNLFSSPQHPIPGSFSVHWAKEDNFLLLTFQNFAKIVKM